MITASCGCKLTDAEGIGKDIVYKDHARDGSKVVTYAVFCDKCFELYEKEGIILKTKQEENDWLQGKTKYDLRS